MNLGGIVATGAVAPGGTLDVVGNKIATTGPGIVVGPDATVDSNAVNQIGGQSPGTDGIVVAAGSFTSAPGHVRITGNRVHDRSGTGIALRTSVRTFMVKENVVANAFAGIAIEGRGAAERVAIDNNELLDIAAVEQEGAEVAIGILVARARSTRVAGNTVAGVGRGLQEARLRGGIVVLASDDVKVSGNVVEEIGRPDGFLGLAVGIAAVGPFDAVSAADNSSRFDPDTIAPTQGGWHALLIQSAGGELVNLGAGKAVVPVSGGNAVVFTNGWAFAAAGRGDHAGVSSNTVSGGGTLPTCLVRVNGEIAAEGNQCLHNGEQQPAGIWLEASALTASTNRVRGVRSMLVLKVDEKRFAAVGNLAAGGTFLNAPGGALPNPWKALNPTVS